MIQHFSASLVHPGLRNSKQDDGVFNAAGTRRRYASRHRWISKRCCFFLSWISIRKARVFIHFSLARLVEDLWLDFPSLQSQKPARYGSQKLQGPSTDKGGLTSSGVAPLVGRYEPWNRSMVMNADTGKTADAARRHQKTYLGRGWMRKAG